MLHLPIATGDSARAIRVTASTSVRSEQPRRLQLRGLPQESGLPDQTYCPEGQSPRQMARQRQAESPLTPTSQPVKRARSNRPQQNRSERRRETRRVSDTDKKKIESLEKEIMQLRASLQNTQTSSSSSSSHSSALARTQ